MEVTEHAGNLGQVNPRHIPRWLSVILAAASGLVLELAFPGTDAWALAFVAIAGLALATLRDSVPWNFLVGTIWGLGFFLPHIMWAQYAVGGNLPWIALSAFQALFVGLFASSWTIVRRSDWIARNSLRSAAAFALLWLGTESLRSNFPWGGFPWGRLGFSQSTSPLAQYAWLAGIPLITFVVALIGFLTAVVVLALLRLDMWRIGSSAFVSVAVILAAIFIPLSNKAQTGTLHVGAVQGNVSKPGADAFANRQEVLDNHVAGTLALAERENSELLDIVVWPENASDIDPQVDAGASALIDSASAAVGTPILVGAQEYPATGGRINLSLLWQHGQGVIGSYAKQRPVPFGEYIPNRDFFRKIYPDVDRISTDMFAGTEPAALDVPIARLERDVVVGPIICFEVGIDQVIHDSIKNGAEILFVQTNNASFGPTNESIQQLAMSRLRAIETGRAVVHVSTVGVSAIYTPTGTELERTDHFTAEQMMQELVLRDSRTPAVFLGEIPVWISWAGSVLLLVTGLFSRHRREVS